MTYSPVAPDPSPEPETYHDGRLYTVLADVVQPDGALLAMAGDVVNETVRERVAAAVNGNAARYLRPVLRDIPFDGSDDMSAADAGFGVAFEEWWEMHGFQCRRFDDERGTR
jgi:hypothetical protein